MNTIELKKVIERKAKTNEFNLGEEHWEMVNNMLDQVIEAENVYNEKINELRNDFKQYREKITESRNDVEL